MPLKQINPQSVIVWRCSFHTILFHINTTIVYHVKKYGCMVNSEETIGFLIKIPELFWSSFTIIFSDSDSIPDQF